MPEPRIAGKHPAVLELAAGTYWYCACGGSSQQPFCDGSHQGTGFSPLKVDLAEAGKIAFCLCKRSVNLPRCDGTHRNL